MQLVKKKIESKEYSNTSIETTIAEKPVIKSKKERKTRSSKNVLTPLESKKSTLEEQTIVPIETEVKTVSEETKTPVEEVKSKPIAVDKQQKVTAKGDKMQSDENKIASKKAILGPTVSIAGVAKGYYIIVNVFSKPENANRFLLELKMKGIKSSFFINPVNNYRYIYIDKTDTFEQAASLFYSYLDGKYLEPLWVMTVNE